MEDDERPLEPGDRVQAKSGDGPVMTVRVVSGRCVDCHWFEGSKIKFAVFNESDLVRFRPPGRPVS